jgi:hypothetical protein
MNIKRIVTIGLLLFVVASVGMPILRSITRPRDLGLGIRSPARPDAIVVCYFRAKVRCAACRTLEACSIEVVQQRFAVEALAGSIEWQAVDYQSHGNEYLLAEYGMITGGVLLVKFRDGHPLHWLALPDTWNMTSDRTALVDYLAEAIDRFRRVGP